MTALFRLLSLYLVFLGGNYALAETIPADVKSTVTFIFVDKAGEAIPNGTGFFVMVKDERDVNKGWGYLVTVKHVIQDDSRNFLPFVRIRLNKKDGESDLIMIPLNGNEALPVYVHPDPDVDLAVIPIFPN